MRSLIVFLQGNGVYVVSIYQPMESVWSKRMKKIFGYLCLILSVVTWGVIALLPFIEISKGQVAVITTALVIAGEILFLIAIALLGKEVWQHIKAIFKGSK